jgi:hypothetical protein
MHHRPHERTNERTHSDRSRDAVDLSFSKAKKKVKTTGTMKTNTHVALRV